MQASLNPLAVRTLATMVCLFPLVAGCGSNVPFDYVQVSGKVTYEDGTLIPADKIIVTFDPQAEALDAQTHPQPARAVVNVADGTFEQVSSLRVGDGLVPGKHKVLVVALDENENPTAAVPREYSTPSQTPLVYDTADAPFWIKVRKP